MTSPGRAKTHVGRVEAAGLCTQCGTCAGVCPADAVDPGLGAALRLAGARRRRGAAPTAGSAWRPARRDLRLPARDAPWRERNAGAPSPTSWVPGGACGSAGRPTRTCATGARPAGSPRRSSPACSKTACRASDGEQVPVDAVVCAARRPDERARRATGAGDERPTEVAACRGSKYNAVAMNEALRHIRATPGRYVLVGLPCHLQGLRLAQARSATLRERVVLALGIFCGWTSEPRATEVDRAACRARPGRPRDGVVPRPRLARRDATRDARRRGATTGVPRLLRPGHGRVHAAALPPVRRRARRVRRTSRSATPGSTGSPTTRPSRTASRTSSRGRPPASAWSSELAGDASSRCSPATPDEMVASQTEAVRIKRRVLRGRLWLRRARRPPRAASTRACAVEPSAADKLTRAARLRRGDAVPRRRRPAPPLTIPCAGGTPRPDRGRRHASGGRPPRDESAALRT